MSILLSEYIEKKKNICPDDFHGYRDIDEVEPLPENEYKFDEEGDEDEEDEEDDDSES